MMSTRSLEVSHLRVIPQCWLYQNRQYKYIENGKHIALLPTVSPEYKELLDELQIPNRPASNGKDLELWDPACYEEVEMCLPMYVCMGNNYRYIKDYTGTVISQETSDKAFDLWDTRLKLKIEVLEKKKQDEAIFSDLKKALNGRIACGIDASLRQPDLSSCLYRESYRVIGDEKIKVFPVHILISDNTKANLLSKLSSAGVNTTDAEIDCQRNTDYIAVFDLNKVHTGAVVEMHVPAGSEGIFVGRNGWQVREWCMKLGLQKIIVKGV